MNSDKRWIVDTHAHLDFEAFDADRAEVILRAREAEIGAIINVAIDRASSEASVALASEYPDVWATVGVHPHDAASVTEEDYAELLKLGKHPKVVAVGEVGLDYYRNLSPEERQKEVFRDMLTLARELDLPLIIHTRAAGEDTLAVLREALREGPLRGVFHCFSGDVEMARQVLGLGFYISFCGNLTFKNSRAPEVLKEVPLERLLLETDSPFLAPVPYRGKRNEPAYVRLTARKIAEVKGVPVSEVSAVTTRNAVELFGIELGKGTGGDTAEPTT